jgi:hypothetical protein
VKALIPNYQREEATSEVVLSCRHSEFQVYMDARVQPGEDSKLNISMEQRSVPVFGKAS